MAWINVAIIGGSALMNMRNNQAKADQQKRYNLAQAETTRYSPWTGMKGQLDTSYVPDGFSSAVAGGLQGASIAQGLSGLSAKASTPSVPTEGGTMDASMFGNQQYQQQQANPWKVQNIFGSTPNRTA